MSHGCATIASVISYPIELKVKCTMISHFDILQPEIHANHMSILM